VQFIFSENCVVHEVMWKNVVQRDTEHIIAYYGACAFQAS